MRVLRILNSYRLGCGCLVGVYELYGGEIVVIVDEPTATCPDPLHKAGQPLREAPPAPPAAPAP